MVDAPEKKKSQRSRSGRSWSRLRARAKKAFGLLGRVLFFLVILPIRALLLGWVLTTRFFLVIATLVLVLYFVATTVITGPLVLGIVNDNLLGTFQADHVEVSLVTAKVQLFNVRITHPMGHDIVHARRVATGIDAAGIIFWGAKSIIGVSGAMPLLLRETRLDDYNVLLPFDEDGMHFVEAFLPKVVSTDKEPSGPSPVVTLSHVVLGPGYPRFRQLEYADYCGAGERRHAHWRSRGVLAYGSGYADFRLPDDWISSSAGRLCN